MKNPLITRALNRILRPIDKFKIHRQAFSLPEISEREGLVADEFRAKISELNIPDSQGMTPAQRAWNDNMHTLQRMVESHDPRAFLSWDVVAGTMFVKYAKYSRTEYGYLRSLADWPRWKEALREDDAGLPAKCPFDTSTSCNLVHHAYHVAQFEKFSNETVSNFDYVFEFGGGYGSMCRLFFKLGFKGRYLIVDLPAFSALQEYFLKSVGIKVLTTDEFIKGESGVLCASDIDELDDLIGGGRKSLFLATWSISESPLFVREKILGKYSNAFDAYLVAFQPKFEDVDNAVFFEKLRADHPDYSWVTEDMAHLKKQKYLFGKKSFSN
jgi:hypothetical protein